MLIAPILWLTLGAVTASPVEDSWYRVRISVPSVLTLDRLQNSDLNLMECIPHLGTTDVAVGPGEFAKLDKGGYTYNVISKLEDPRNWEERHGGVYAANDNEYRLHYFNADQILAFYENLRTLHPTVVTRRNIGAGGAWRFFYAAIFRHSLAGTAAAGHGGGDVEPFAGNDQPPC